MELRSKNGKIGSEMGFCSCQGQEAGFQKLGGFVKRLTATVSERGQGGGKESLKKPAEGKGTQKGKVT